MRLPHLLRAPEQFYVPEGELQREDARIAAYRIIQTIKGNYRQAIQRETRGMDKKQVALVLEEVEHLITGCKIAAGRPA